MQHLLALGNTYREDTKGNTRSEHEVLKEAEMGQGKLLSRREKAGNWLEMWINEAKDWVNANLFPHTHYSRHWIHVCFCSSSVKWEYLTLPTTHWHNTRL